MRCFALLCCCPSSSLHTNDLLWLSGFNGGRLEAVALDPKRDRRLRVSVCSGTSTARLWTPINMNTRRNRGYVSNKSGYIMPRYISHGDSHQDSTHTLYASAIFTPRVVALSWLQPCQCSDVSQRTFVEFHMHNSSHALYTYVQYDNVGYGLMWP